MKRSFRKPAKEIIVEAFRRLLRLTSFYNEYENQILAEEFYDELKLIKEENSKIVFNNYYLPKAISAILKEDGYLISEQQAYPRAIAMMLSDMANGILSEFYKFNV